MPAARTAAGSTSNPFIKQLASSDRSIRDRALSSLRTYLHRQAPFTDLDFLKLWKGLFYSMFMSDKPRNQQQLARDLAKLVDACATRENTLGFIDAFWKTMGREWSGIDSLRMDKYLYLVRCYVRKGFEACAKGAWRDEEMLELYLDIMGSEGGPLSPRDAKVPNGLRLHVVDVWLDELEQVDEENTAPTELVMAPVRRLEQETLAKNIRERAKECLNDERWKVRLGTAADDGEHDLDGAARDGDHDDEGDFAGFDD